MPLYDVPDIYDALRECFERIEKDFIDQPSLYRESGSMRYVDSMCQHFLKGEPFGLDSVQDCSVITSLVKTLVRRLTTDNVDSLISYEVYDGLCALHELLGLGKTRYAQFIGPKIHSLLESFADDCQRKVLDLILTHLRTISSDGMPNTPASLAICWGPTLMGAQRFQESPWFMEFLLSYY